MKYKACVCLTVGLVAIYLRLKLRRFNNFGQTHAPLTFRLCWKSSMMVFAIGKLILAYSSHTIFFLVFATIFMKDFVAFRKARNSFNKHINNTIILFDLVKCRVKIIVDLLKKRCCRGLRGLHSVITALRQNLWRFRLLLLLDPMQLSMAPMLVG